MGSEAATVGSRSCAEGNRGQESSIGDNRTQWISDRGGSEI